MTRIRILLSIAFAALLIAAPAGAKTIFPSQGSPGDRTDRDECPTGSYLIGFSGQVGSWIDQIRILCGAANVGVGFDARTYEGPVRGGNSGAPMQVECPVGSAINRIGTVYTEENRQVKSIGWNCGKNAPAWDKVFGQAVDSNYNSETLGSDIKECPSGEQPIGLVISSGRHVNGIGLICDRLVRPPCNRQQIGNGMVICGPLSAPAPAAPATSPISKTGKAIPSGTASSSASAVQVTAFRGSWDTTANGTNHYTLVLQITSPKMTNPFLADLQVVGQFTNTDGYSQYNGTLQGLIRKGTRTLTYSYTQPEANLSGEGVFELSADGNTITGSGTHAGVTFSWNGERANGAAQ